MSSNNIIKTIQYLIIGMVILVPLIYYPTSMFPFQIVKTVFFQTLAAIIFLFWLQLAIFYKEYRPRLTWVSLSLIIFYAVIFLSIVFGSDWRMSLWSDEQRALGFFALVHFGGLFLVLTSLRKQIDWRKLFLVPLDFDFGKLFLDSSVENFFFFLKSLL